MHTRLQNQDHTAPGASSSKGFRPRPFANESEPETAEQSGVSSQTESATRLGHNFGQVSVLSPKLAGVQTKLTVGAPDDAYEQEADRVAAQVMQMPTPDHAPGVQRQTDEDEVQTKPLASSITPLIQRQASEEEDHTAPDTSTTTSTATSTATPAATSTATPTTTSTSTSDEDEVQTKPLLQRSGKQPAPAGQDLETRLSQTQGGGSPLPDETRSFMESRFGNDFSQVRIHTGSDAVQMNQELSAQAFTHGQDVYFGAGKYDPSSHTGKALLAHELTHVVQQTGGVQRKPAEHRESVQTISAVPTGQAVQRRGQPRSPNAHVGAEPGHYTFLDNGAGDVVAPGDAGYSRRMLSQVGGAADALSGNYADMQLENVVPSLGGIDAQLRKRAAEVSHFHEKAGEFGNLPSTEKIYNRAATWCQNHMQAIETQRAQEDEKAASFNSWVPRANGFYTSLTRLDAMQDMLGVTDPNAMVTALTQGLQDAERVGRRAQAAHDAGSADADQLPVPPTDNSVADASRETTQAAQEMNTAYIGFQQNLLRERANATDAEGEQDRQRMQEIQEVKQFVRNVGKTVDVTMSVVSGAPAAIANATETVQRAGATVNAVRNQRQARAGQRQTHNPTYVTVDKDGQMVVRNVQTGMDRPIEGGEQTASPESSFSLPTSVENILGTIVDFAYSSEVREINMRLEQIKSRCDAIRGAADLLAIRERAQNFQDKLNNFAQRCYQLQQRIQQRRQAYLEFGVELDRFARRDAASRQAGQAPAAGEERYATIMTVTSQIREVLSIGRGATSGFDTPAQFASWAQDIDATRGQSPPRTDIDPFSVPAAEWRALDRMYGQVSTFHHNVGQIDRIFGPVETAASSLIGTLHQGSGGRGGAY